MSRLWVHAEEFEVDVPLTLSADESRHVAARRARVGELVTLFDGEGRLGEARIESLGRRGVLVRPERSEQVERPGDGWILATAIPKGERLATLLPMLTQLGVAIWQPLVLFDSAQRELDVASTRMQRILIESAKLARRAWLLETRAPVGLEGLLSAAPRTGAPIVFGDREGERAGVPADAGLVVVGPEAGFTAEEVARLRAAGATACRLAAHNLRIETAAVAAAATRFAAAGSDD